MLNHVPQVGSVGAWMGVLHSAHVGPCHTCVSAAWCRNDPSEYLCVNEGKSG